MEGLIRPKDDSPVAGGTSFLGFQEASIIEIKDRQSEFSSWADVYIDVQLATNNSKYSTTLRVKGSYKRDSQGNVMADSKLVKDIYALFDAIGYSGGINAKGEFCDASGNATNVENELSTFASGKQADDSTHNFNLYVYVYKEMNKKTRKVYTVVLNYVQPNDDSGREKLESRIEFLQKNNYLNEVSQEELNSMNNGVANNVTVDNVLDSVVL
jgi:hypothetical protein